MSVSVWIFLILTFFPAEGFDTTLCFMENPQSEVIWTEESEITILCDVISGCLPLQTWWFVFNESGQQTLGPNTTSTSLIINATGPESNALYVCALVSDSSGERGSQRIGRGTTLIVRGGAVVRHILLWLLFALLSIYNLTIMVIIYRKKTRAKRNPCVGMRATPKESNTTSRLHFRSVVQELYNRRNLHSKEADKDGREGQPRRAEEIRSKPSNEDIYQNL